MSIILLNQWDIGILIDVPHLILDSYKRDNILLKVYKGEARVWM
jgi:hypothetical protein